MANETLQTFMDSFLAADTLLAARQALGLEIGVDVKAEGSAPAAHTHLIADVTGLQAALDAAGGGDPASESVAGIVEYATQAEVDAANGTTTDQVMRAKHNRIKWIAGTINAALIIGDLSGDSRGEGAVCIAPDRLNTDEIASGQYAIAIGYRAQASTTRSVSIGYNSIAATAVEGTAIGSDSQVLAGQGVAVGYSAGVGQYGSRAIAIGNNATAAGQNDICIGNEAYSLATAGHNIVIGTGQLGTGDDDNVVIGNAADVAGVTDSNVVIGYATSVDGAGNVIIGHGADGDGYCVTIGQGAGNTLQGAAVAIGYGCDSADYSLAIGYLADAPGTEATSVGSWANASGQFSIAMGYATDATAYRSMAIGINAQSTVLNQAEIGLWYTTTDRDVGIRMDGANGFISASLRNSASAPTDGGTTPGSEAAGTIPREMYSIRRSGDALYIDINVAGTIKTLSLGTAA